MASILTNITNILFGQPKSDYDKTTSAYQAFQKGIHKSNHYRLFIQPPKKVLERLSKKYGYSPNEIVNALDNLCINFNLPNGTLSTAGVRTMGEVREMPYDKIYDQASFTFYLDANGMSYKIFREWMNTVYDPSTKIYGYYSDYVSNIGVVLYEHGYSNGTVVGQGVMSTELREAYPTTISPITLTGLSGNTPTQFDVTFRIKEVRDNPEYANDAGFIEAEVR